MNITLEKKQGLIAGDGDLPVKLARAAKMNSFNVVAIALSAGNKAELSKYCTNVYSFGPGEVQNILDTLVKEDIKQLSFVGKVHKGLLLKNPKLDKRALGLLKQKKKLNDDEIMLTIVNELEKEGIAVLDQTIFLKELLAPNGLIGNIEPTEQQKMDIEYGFSIAKEIGKLDIGQTVIVKNKMILAVEAIEGTDKTIERGCKLAKGNAVVVKVSKPSQDKRFDIPTIGMKTLKTMKKHGANVLAVEAGQTFVAQKEEIVGFADKNGMVIYSI